MVTSVNTNVNALAAVISLTEIGNQLTSTQSAIESGLKVNQASDNPAVFSIAQGLRANVNALQAVSDSLASGTATAQVATQGATSISNALTTLLQTVTQAQNSTGSALVAYNATITTALANIDAYANAATINGTNLLSAAGTLNILSNVSGTNSSVTTATASTSTGLGLAGLSTTSVGTTVVDSSIVTLSTAGTAGDIVTYVDGSTGLSQSFTFGSGTGQVAVGASATLSATNLVNAMAAAGITGVSSTGGAITATGGYLTGSNSNYVTTGGPALNDVITVGTQGYTFITQGTAPTTNYQVNLGGNAVQSMANMAAKMAANGIAATSNAAGQLTVANPTLATTSGVTGATVTSNVASGAASIALVNAAISKIGSTLSYLGATTLQLQGLSSFTSSLSASVTTGLGALVDANLSSESAMLASLQTKQSLAIQSLSLANQGPGALLSLFR